MARSTNMLSHYSTGRRKVTYDIAQFKEAELHPLPKQQPVVHLLFLDGLRAIAAMYVVLHHAVSQIKMPEGKIYTLFSNLFSKGHFAVDVFIVLSGFCLMLPEVRTNRLRVQPLHFIKKRLKRILPTYYLAMALSLLLIYTVIGTPSGTHWDESIPVSKWDLFTHLALIHDLFNITNAKINHSFWSISVEFRIYLLFPFLVALFRKTRPVLATIGIVFLTVCAWGLLKRFAVFNSSPWGINPHYLGLFAIGMLAAYVAYSTKPAFVAVRKSRVLLIAPVLLFVVALNLDVYKWGLWIVADIAIGISCACLLVALAANRVPALYRVFSWKPLVFCGTFAYSIYLVHAPLLEVFSRYWVDYFQLSTTAAVFSFVFIATPLITGCSYLFYLVAEKPFIRKKPISKVEVAV